MKQLTKAEEEIMQILWELEEASVSEIIEHFPEPKPAYNTVSTIIRILESKEIVGYYKKGRGHIYLPKVPKSDYSKQSLNKLVDGYFQGSFKNMVSFFVKENKMDVKEMEEILNLIKKDK